MGIPAVPQTASLAACLATTLENILFPEDLSLCEGLNLPCEGKGVVHRAEGVCKHLELSG